MVNESIDSEYKTGGKIEKRRVWSSWAIKHFSEMKLLKVAGLFSKREGWRNAVEHSLVVNATANYLARKIAGNGHVVNKDLVDTASMLHDIAKRTDKKKGVSRDEEHAAGATKELLKDYPDEVVRVAQYTGRVPEIYLTDEEQELAIDARPIDDLIVAYVDARIRNTNVVSLEEARDKNKQKIPDNAAFYDKWYNFYRKVEERLIALADMPPTELSEENIFQMVKADKN